MLLPKFLGALAVFTWFIPLAIPSYADKLYLGFAKEPLQELLAPRDIQAQVLLDRTDPNFIDITDNYENGMMKFSVEKTFASENWDISVSSNEKSNGAFERVMYLSPHDDEANGLEWKVQTFCEEVNSLLEAALGEPNIHLDVSPPLPDENRWMSSSRLRSTWHHQGLGVSSNCLAVHWYDSQAEAGPIKTRPAFATVSLSEIEEMETLHPLSHVTCSYQGTFRTEELPEGVDQTIKMEVILNETGGELLQLDKRTLARDVIFTDGEITGGWEDKKFVREFSINRYSGTSSFSAQSVSGNSEQSYTSSSGECLANTERKF